MLCATYFNSFPAAVYVLCVRHYQKVVFIGATIMAMGVGVFVIYVKFYFYLFTTLQEIISSKLDTSL